MKQMLLPLALIALAFVSAGFMTYGTNPNWAQFRHGVDLIMAARQWQWPLVVVSLLGCLGLILLVISGKRRAWWLIGLGPIMALFVHRFVIDPVNAFSVRDNPVFVEAQYASFIGDSDYVVGLTLDGDAYAYPYAALYSTPVVVQDLYEKRMVLMWSAFANRAMANMVSRDLKARDLEIVSMPANALLVYDRRLGQFINAVTGVRLDGKPVTGFKASVDVIKMPWPAWRGLHPQTRVMVPTGKPGWSVPMYPYYKMPPAATDVAARTRIALVPVTQPVAVPAEQMDEKPVNVSVGSSRLVLWRDPATGVVSGFDRAVKGDLFPSFKPKRNPRHPEAVFVDSDGGSFWTADGRAVDGPLKGERLKRVGVESDLYWGVMKFWMPGLKLVGKAD